jgi:hypothetical protein
MSKLELTCQTHDHARETRIATRKKLKEKKNHEAQIKNQPNSEEQNKKFNKKPMKIKRIKSIRVIH